MKEILYGVKYMVKYHVFQKKPPLIRGLVVTDRCNLRCRHCRLSNRGREDLCFEEITTAIQSFYREGGRNLYLEGGEPFLWHDGQHTLEDIVEYARKTGFLSVIIYTNGTMPLMTTADTVFISVDGLEKTHDSLRGKSFSTIMNNIQASGHPSLFINFTINSCNKDEIEEFCEYIKGIRQIRGIFFYFHTPYYGHDNLYIDPAGRNEIILKLLHYKKKYKILNSRAGLMSALRNDWKRPLDICSVYENGTTYRCCRISEDPALCRNCGYLSYAEIQQTLKLKPSAILNAIQYF